MANSVAAFTDAAVDNDDEVEEDFGFGGTKDGGSLTFPLFENGVGASVVATLDGAFFADEIADEIDEEGSTGVDVATLDGAFFAEEITLGAAATGLGMEEEDDDKEEEDEEDVDGDGTS